MLDLEVVGKLSADLLLEPVLVFGQWVDVVQRLEHSCLQLPEEA